MFVEGQPGEQVLPALEPRKEALAESVEAWRDTWFPADRLLRVQLGSNRVPAGDGSEMYLLGGSVY